MPGSQSFYYIREKGTTPQCSSDPGWICGAIKSRETANAIVEQNNSLLDVVVVEESILFTPNVQEHDEVTMLSGRVCRGGNCD